MLGEIILPPRHRWLIKHYSAKFGQVQLDMSGRLVDRTGTIEFYKGLEIKNTSPLPNNTGNSLDLEDCITDSVEQIWKAVSNKQIHVLWSGGIDSTAALVALLADNTPVKIIYSESSKKENPTIYNWLLEKEKNHSWVELSYQKSVIDYLKEIDLDNKLIITGEIGDQVMGHFYNTTSFPQLNDEEYMLSKDVFSFVKFIEDEQLRKDWEDFSHIMYEVRQSEIETVFDMLWWANFTTKYTFCIHRLSLWVEKQLPTTSFYNTKQFQIWSMNHNWKLKCNGNWWTHYKMPLKKYIYDNTGNEASLLTVKRPSLVQDHNHQVGGNKYIDKDYNIRWSKDVIQR